MALPRPPPASTTWSSCGRCASRPSGSGRSAAAAAGGTQRNGQALLAHPEARWRAVAASLTAGGGFEAAAAELALTLLLGGTNSEPEPLDLLAAVLADDGWQERGSGQPPSGQAVRAALAALVRPARLFGLLTPGDVWSPLPTGLTELGRATAPEALRTGAAGATLRPVTFQSRPGADDRASRVRGP